MMALLDTRLMNVCHVRAFIKTSIGKCRLPFPFRIPSPIDPAVGSDSGLGQRIPTSSTTLVNFTQPETAAECCHQAP